MLTQAELRAYFPALPEIGPAQWDILLETACFLRGRVPLHLKYCMAHLITLLAEDTGKPDGGSGEVAHETAGALVNTYKTQANASEEVFYTRTSYGRTLLTMTKQTAVGMFFNA